MIYSHLFMRYMILRNVIPKTSSKQQQAYSKVFQCKIFFINICLPRSIQHYKSELASRDEQCVLKMASLYTAAFVFDNLNKVINILPYCIIV